MKSEMIQHINKLKLEAEIERTGSDEPVSFMAGILMAAYCAGLFIGMHVYGTIFYHTAVLIIKGVTQL